MNFEKVQRKNRKAISPVLATVILIAITLIAAIAIAGFVFGLFGTFTSTAQVQASVTSCVASTVANQEDCTLILTNSGNAATSTTTACSLTFKGATYSGYVSVAGNAAVGASIAVPVGSTSAHCTSAGAPAAAGAGVQVTGSVVLTNGGNALFSAVASS